MSAPSEPECSNETGHSSDFLFPEILPRESLITILKERKVKHKDFTQLEKHQLVDLFHKYVTPLPQRQYRDNRRGKKMTQVRLKQESLKRKDDDNKTHSDEPQSKSQKISEFHRTPPSDRLKPPPVTVNWERKVIKLTSSDARTSNSSLEATSPKVQRNSTQKTTLATQPDKTNERRNSTSSSTIVLTPTTTRKLKLKRASEDEPTNGKNNVTEESSPPETLQKKKHNPITWP